MRVARLALPAAAVLGLGLIALAPAASAVTEAPPIIVRADTEAPPIIRVAADPPPIIRVRPAADAPPIIV